MSSESVAELLEEAADLLESQNASRFRTLAYRKAAGTLRGLPVPVEDLVRSKGREGLVSLPYIGESIAHHILEIVETGRFHLVEKLRDRVEPEALLRTIPGIGEHLANRIHEDLGIERLEELELAAHDGRLAKVPGFGPRRLRGVTESLAGRLGQRSRARAGSPTPSATPAIADLLDVDREYREKATAGELARIAPRRFNPQGRRWLPVLHTQRGDFHYTALFSNTARAHQLGRTHDWVIVYYHTDDARDGQSTVVTELRGPLSNQRVVRGREEECRKHYEDLSRHRRKQHESRVAPSPPVDQQEPSP